jgi:chromosome segregation ATPase
MNSRARRNLASFAIAGLSVSGAAFAVAQDVPGIEICTRESRLDRRTGCLQSNAEYLQQVVARNALDAAQKLGAANRDIAALKEQVAAANREVAALKDALAAVEARLDAFKKAEPAPVPPAAAAPAPAPRAQGK